MEWSEIKIHTTNEAIEPVSNILHESGASGVVIVDPFDLEKDHVTLYGTIYELDTNNYPAEGVFVKSYLPTDEKLDETVESIKSSINELPKYGVPIGKNQLTVSQVHEEDWANAWKKYYKPVNISDRITITPTWEEYMSTSDDEVIIELDPGMAFGTGTHPTTVLSLRAIEKYLQKDDVVIDVGSGSGVLSIASALLGASSVYAFDLDEVAVSSTKNNAALNKADAVIQAQKNDLLNGVSIQADLIVSNILAEIIVKFTDDAYHAIKPGGYFITSGIIQRKREEVISDLEHQGFSIIETNEMEEWVSIVAQKPKSD